MKRSRTLAAFVCSVMVVAGVASCVMPSDLRAIQENMAEFQEGAVTKPEFDQRNVEIIQTMDERNAELIAAGSQIPTDPVSLLLYLAGAAGTITASVKGTNMVRDGRRKKRDEPV